jgi:hypothetical protein
MNIQTTISKIFFFLSILSFTTSCSEFEKPTLDEQAKNKFKTVIQTEDYELQYFEFDATNGGELVGSLGTRLNFPEFSFEDMNGFLVEGKIKLELKEYYVDIEGHSDQMSLKEDNKLLSDCSFELRAFDGDMPLIFLNNLDIAGMIE